MSVRYATALGALLVVGCGLSLAGSNPGEVQSRDAGFEASAAEGAATVDGGDGGASSPPAEDCLNGIDDDGNGQVDCADPACVPGYACVQVPTSGFSKATLYPGGEGATLVACGDGGAAAMYHETPKDSPPVTCGACACSPPSGADCSSVTVTCYKGGGCAGTIAGSFDAKATCKGDTITEDVKTCSSTTPSYLPGNCTPDGGVPSRSPAFGRSYAVCADISVPVTGGGGCGAGYVCANKPTVDAGALACLRPLQAGACPTGWVDSRALYPHGGVNDTRGCTPCTCGDDTGGTCAGGTVHMHAGSGCVADDQPFNAGTCGAVDIQKSGASNHISGTFEGATLTLGACAPAGGAPQGSVDAGTPETFCCRK